MPARLFEYAGEQVSDRFAWVVLREREVSRGLAKLFGVLKTRDLLGRELTGQISPSGCRVVPGRRMMRPRRLIQTIEG